MACAGMSPWMQWGFWPPELSNLPRVCWPAMGQALPATATLCACPMSTRPSTTSRYPPRSGRHQYSQNDSLERIFLLCHCSELSRNESEPKAAAPDGFTPWQPLAAQQITAQTGDSPSTGSPPWIRMTTQKSRCSVAASLKVVFNKRRGFSIPAGMCVQCRHHTFSCRSFSFPHNFFKSFTRTGVGTGMFMRLYHMNIYAVHEHTLDQPLLFRSQENQLPFV